VQVARELFDLAVADEDAGRWEVALEKLRAVLTTRDTPGVRYHLGLCEERLGRLSAAEADFALAETTARAEKADDVLRLVGKKLAEVARRVPHITVRVAPDLSDATLTLDGKVVEPGNATPVDPGPHEVVVVATGRSQSVVRFTVDEGESRSVDAHPGPPAAPAAPTEPAPSATTARDGTTGAADARASRPVAGRTAAIVEVGGAALLAGTGVLAFAEAGAARDQAARSCARLDATSSAACDPYRVAVREWDWTAVGAWAGAATLATWAAVTWVKAGASSRVVVGAGSVKLEGAF
jgi:hypothetical protein